MRTLNAMCNKHDALRKGKQGCVCETECYYKEMIQSSNEIWDGVGWGQGRMVMRSFSRINVLGKGEGG